MHTLDANFKEPNGSSIANDNSLGALVIGGASGIGLATVEKLLKDGLRVVMADIDDTSGQTVQKRLKTVYKHISFVKVDVCQSKDIDNCISKAADVLGVIDVAVNSCGDIGRLAEAQDISWDDWRHVMDIGLDGAWRFSTAMVRYFRAQEPRLVRHDLGNARAWSPVYQKGSLVNIAASVGHVGHRLMAPYCASNAGIVMMSKSLALENGELGIRVNVISPGFTEGPMLEKAFESLNAKTGLDLCLEDQTMGRLALPEEIAAAVAFVAMDGASFMTGSSWGPDGGYHVA